MRHMLMNFSLNFLRLVQEIDINIIVLAIYVGLLHYVHNIKLNFIRHLSVILLENYNLISNVIKIK